VLILLAEQARLSLQLIDVDVPARARPLRRRAVPHPALRAPVARREVHHQVDAGQHRLLQRVAGGRAGRVGRRGQSGPRHGDERLLMSRLHVLAPSPLQMLVSELLVTTTSSRGQAAGRSWMNE
jgi:hypothetical protein